MAFMIDYDTRIPADLSLVQFQVLRYIIEFREHFGRSPSGGEISEHFAWKSTTSAYKHVKALMQREYLTCTESNERLNTWKLTTKGQLHDPRAIPLLGCIPAGDLDDAVETEATMIYGLKDLLPSVQSTDVICNVTTNVLRENGVPNGSLVVARPGMKCEDGCLAMLKYQARLLLRYVTYRDDTIVLEAANKNYETIVAKAKDVTILGPVIATIRTKTFEP